MVTGSDVWVDGDDSHPEGRRTRRYLLTDASVADEQEGAALELDTPDATTNSEVAAAGRAVELDRNSRRGQHQHHRVLGDADGIDRPDQSDGYAEGRAGIDGDVVVPDAMTRDHPQPRTCSDNRDRQWRITEGQRVGLTDVSEQVRLGDIRDDHVLDVVTGVEQR